MENTEPENINENELAEQSNHEYKAHVIPKPILEQDKKNWFVSRSLV